MDASRHELPPSPRDSANPISILFFAWTAKIFKLGYSKTLELSDLFRPVDKDRSEKLGSKLERRWYEQVKSGKPSLLKAIVKTYWPEYLVLGIIQLLQDVLVRISSPILLGRLLSYFEIGSTVALQDAYLYAGGIVLLTAFTAFSMNHWTLGAFHGGMRVRVGVCSLIFRKATRLSNMALGHTAPGKIVNLLSNDVSRFDIVSIFIHSMWSAPLLSIIVAYLIYLEADWPGLIGIIVVFLVVPIQAYAGKLSGRFRLQTAMKTDERVRFMDEIISGIQVIKMYAWEKPFSKLIKMARVLELRVIRKNAYVRGLYMTFSLFTTRTAMFCTMLAIVLSGGRLTATTVFVVNSYYNVISQTMTQMFVRGIAEIAEAIVAVRRLQNFLEFEERDTPAQQLTPGNLNGNMNGDDKKPEKKSVNTSGLPDDVALVIRNGTAKWKTSAPDDGKKKKKKKSKKSKSRSSSIQDNDDWKLPTLDNLNVEVKKGQLIGIIGSVGSGKSSLLQAILSELPWESGNHIVNGKMSYTCQEPWVFSASVKQNILFGSPMDSTKYKAVIKTCALSRDLEQLSDGDQTIIGERGSSLSGGQKARVSLARACYRDADIYLLDDPLSAVDAHVGRHLFDECIGPHGRLAQLNATRILVTHQVHFLKEADWIIVMKEGKIDLQGSPQDLARNGVDIVKLVEESEDETEDEVEESDDQAATPLKKQISRTVSTSSSKRSRKGSESEKQTEDKSRLRDAALSLEGTSKGTVEGSVLFKYFGYAANVVVGFIIFMLFVITQGFASGADYWVSFWTNQEEQRFYIENQEQITPEQEEQLAGLLTTNQCIYIHAGLVAGIFVIGITRSVAFFQAAIRASHKLHDGMFKSLVNTTMRFFDVNPSGRIMNRFSKDMGAVDEMLPKSMVDAVQIIFSMLGVIIIVAIVNPIFLAVVAFLSIIFYFIRKIYLKSSKNIKRLEGITRSPVFTHLGATLTGLSTVRAFNAEEALIQEFDEHQNLHSGAYYMFITTSSAFGLSLDMMTLFFTFFVCFFFLWVDTDILGDQVGLAISQSMGLTGMLQWGIRQSAEVANQLMSVERVMEYHYLDAEPQPPKPVKMADKWPSKGTVEFKNVYYRYYEGAEPVLRGLNIAVRPSEKIGIVGRTGAGKSSLIGAIFRLAKIEGQILLDDIDTATITLHDLRSKVSIIPQDPVLFSGTLRRNLDPFEDYPDKDLWKALEEVELKDIASGPAGLLCSVMAGGSNFSVGQRQLVCLARALIRKNRVLVLDEATANVDPTTDALIQRTIREKFADCTVLTVAHRLHTVMDSDRVLVMDAGIAAEFDAPHILLQKPDGILYGMVMATGDEESAKLKEIAQEKFESNGPATQY